MRYTHILLSKSIVLLLLIVVSACDFGDTNVNPSALTDAPVNLILPAAELQSARNMGSIGARVTGVVIQHFVGTTFQPRDYTTYLIDENSLDDYWRTGLYAGAMKDCIIIIEKGSDQNIPHYTGIARILLAMNLGIATTFWGDVPYSEAFQGQEKFQVPYDDQESIYASIQDLLDDAILELNLPPGDLKPGKDDHIFEGNPAEWIGTARALKARYYMHLSKRDSVTAATNALAALTGGTIYSNDVEPAFLFGEAANEAHPIAFFGAERANQLFVGGFILNLLDANNDPRKPLYARPAGTNTYALYVKGDNIDNEVDLFWGQNDSPMPLISYSELLFLRAEANLYLGNYPEAKDLYEDAIEANMKRVGVADADIQTYITARGDLSALTPKQQQQRIIEQKYIAMFGQGTLEAWVDYRRTGFPLINPPGNVSASFNPSKVIPRRYLYPISERTTNGINRDAAIEKQGGHLQDNTLWAFQ